ncbi:MAG TPA: hypothetical protein DCY95_07815, partial [Algoriphagus sp.]|nr:hypothetical protein [Algoriphagus sp.]
MNRFPLVIFLILLFSCGENTEEGSH